MGDPRRLHKAYKTPPHPWNRDRIEAERILLKDYGLKNKKEIWRAESFLRKCKNQAKRLVALRTAQSKVEEKQLISKLVKLDLIKENARLEDILGLGVRSILDRRLQTIVFNRGIARSVKQARQFVIHGHIIIGDKAVNVPSYLIKKDEENKINVNMNSTLSSLEHPERTKPKSKEEKKEKEKEEKVRKAKKKGESFEDFKKKKKLTAEKLVEEAAVEAVAEAGEE